MHPTAFPSTQEGRYNSSTEVFPSQGLHQLSQGDVGLVGDFPLGWFPAHPGTFKNQRFPTGKFLLHGLGEGNEDEVLHLCSAAAAARAGKCRSSSGEMLPVPAGVGLSWQGWAEPLSLHQTLPGSSVLQGFRAERVHLEFAVPKGLGWCFGGSTVCPQPGWQVGVPGGCTHPVSLPFPRLSPTLTAGQVGVEMPHIEWQHHGGALGAGRDGDGDLQSVSSKAQALGTSLHRPSMGGHLSRAGDTGLGKTHSCGSPRKAEQAKGCSVPHAGRRESGGGRGAAGGTGRGSCPRPPGVGQT